MHKTAPLLIQQCRALRRDGFSLREISRLTNIPYTTLYSYVRDIVTPKILENIKYKQIQNTNRLINFNRTVKKGRCIPGRVVIKPKVWSDDLVYLVAHFMFDGDIRTHSCTYYNRNKALISRVIFFMKKVFNLKPRLSLNTVSGVYRASYYYVELAIYMHQKSKELIEYIKQAKIKEQIIFLKAFFDDEGCTGLWQGKRLVRGYQKNLEILKLIQKLLNNVNINSRVDSTYKEIVISGRDNLIKFQNIINFSEGVYINPLRKNSIWKKKLSKRYILQKIITSYKLS